MEIQELAKELFQNKEVRIFGTQKEPLFVANDIGNIVGLAQVRTTIADFDHTEKIKKVIYTTGGNQEMNLLTEVGLYKLLYVSRKKEAKTFLNWITDTIKEMRQKEYYNHKNTTTLQLEQQLKELQTEIARLKLSYKPKVIYHEYDINDFTNNPCVYLFHLKENDYKFGITGEIDVRYDAHMREFRKKGYDPKLIKLWKCDTMHIMKETEVKIKLLVKYNRNIIFKCMSKGIIYTDNINYVVERIDKYVNDQNSVSDRSFELKKLELELRKMELINEGKRLDLQLLTIRLNNKRTNLSAELHENIASEGE